MKNFTLKITTLIAFSVGTLGVSFAQMTFTNGNSVLHTDAGVAGSNGGVHSGNTVLIVDIDNNGLDDIAKLDENRYLDIEYQQVGGTFVHANNVFDVGSSGDNIWGASMADVDHNGMKDFLYAGWGTGGARIIKLNAAGTGNLGITNLPGGGGIASQACNFMDVNNDGWEDIFVCNDVNECMIWVNDGAGNFPAEANNTAIDFDVTAGTVAPYDESGNYGSVWTDYNNDGDVDLYIAHCRQGTGASDLRRVDVLFDNNGSNVYTSAAAAHGLGGYTQDWTSSFGDIDNDGDFDLFLTGHEAGNTNRLFLNDGSGNFTANAAQPTLSFGSTPQQSFMEDFDNDGFIDVLISGTTTQRLHRNNGNGTFTQVAAPGWTGTWISFACGDLNQDGKIDVYSSYGSIYNNPGSSDDIYWRNNTSNSNHFLTLDLRGTVSNDGALGARAYIYGAWGVQTREVRASESYGTLNSFHLHFGLGSATVVDSVVVEWPSGLVDVLINEPADQFITINEAACTLSGITATPGGPTTFCGGDSLLLTAPFDPTYTYLWSNGATTQTTYVNSTGAYSVTVSTGPGCSASSPAVSVTVDPVESVTISAAGPTTFCPGGSVTLNSSQASNNTWTTTETTQSINVSAAGTYSTSFQGLCQAWPSNSIVVTLLNNAAPVTTDDIIPAPGTGTLTATGVTTNIDWYDAAVGGTLLYTGTTFITPSVSVNTTYYAEETHIYGGGTGNVGSTNIAGSTYSGNTLNGYLKFDVTANCTLLSVEVSTDTPGDRIIELRDNLGAVISSYPVTLATGTTTVPVNFALTPGTDYQLGTNSAQNTTSFGYISPRLVRDNGSPTFPYSLPAVIDITTGNNGGGDVNAYYYFYNWSVDIDPTDICVSARTPATVFITAGIGSESDMNIMVYPNPATDFVTVEFTAPESGEATMAVYDMLGKKVYDLNLGTVNGTVIKTINTSTYASGVYNVKLTINNKDYNTRVVVK